MYHGTASRSHFLDLLFEVAKTMANDPPTAASANGPTGAAANGSSSNASASATVNASAVSATLRNLQAATPAELRQQTGGAAGVVDALGGGGMLKHFQSRMASPIPPLVAAGLSAAAAAAATTSSGPDAGGGSAAQAAAASAVSAPPVDAAALQRHQDDCRMYLRAVAIHVESLVECLHSGIRLDAVAGVVKAAGSAATNLRDRRFDLAQTGIIPALISVAKAYQRPASSAARSSDGSNGDEAKKGDVTMADASTAAAAPGGGVDDSASPCPVLTPAHPELLQCCLLAGHYRAANRLLATIPVRTVSALKAACMASVIALKNTGVGDGVVGGVGLPGIGGSSSSSRRGSSNQLPGVTSETYLRYFYYLGMIRLGCDDLTGAVAAFSVCLTVPCHMVSAITIAARKKMLLCRCLLSDPCGPSDLADASRGTDGDDAEMSRRARAIRRQRLLAVPAAASPAVTRYFGSASPSFTSSAVGLASAPSSSGRSGRGGSKFAPSSSGSSKRSRGVASGDYYAEDIHMAPLHVPMEVERRRVSVTANGAGEEPSEWGSKKPSAEEPDSAGGGGGEGPANEADSARAIREANCYNLGAYDSLVDAFASNDIVEFRRVQKELVDAGILVVDGNAGLASRVETDLLSRSVFATAAIYEVVSMSTLTSEIGLKDDAAEAERILRNLATSGEVVAKIDQQTGMVHFNSGTSEGDDGSDDDDAYRADLAVQMRQCVELADRIRSLDADITASSRYQQIACRNDATKKAAAQSGEGGGKPSGPRGVADLQGAFE